jgi:HK97 family phage major capsid protein
MLELMKLLKAIKAKGFATPAEKAKVAELHKALDADEQDAVDVKEVATMPDADPAEADEVVAEVKSVIKNEAKSIKSELAKSLDESLASMKSDIEKFVAESKKAQAGMYEPSLAEKRAKMNTYLRSVSGAILSNDTATIKELTTDANNSPFGGYVVDSELSAEIRHLVTQYGVARREMFAVGLSKNAYEANALATDVSISWVDEGAVIPSTQIVLDQEELKLKKMAAIVAITRELLEDQEVDLFAFIATRVAEGFAKAEDMAFFNGDGSGTYGGFTGLLNNADVVDVEEFDGNDITAENIYAMIDALPQGAHANAKFYFNRTWLSKIRLIKDGDGRYIYQNPLEVSGVPTLAGYPVVLVEAMPDATTVDAPFMLFGDLKKSSIFGFRSGIGISADRFNAGVVRNVANNADINLITTDREAIRWVQRVGAITILPSAVVRLAPGGSN